jgi:hypothetical protein
VAVAYLFLVRCHFVNTVMRVRLLRILGVCIFLVGLYHLGVIVLMTPLGRSQLLFTYLVFGIVLSVVGLWLLRGNLTTLIHPSRYDVTFGWVSLVVMAYYLSWIVGLPLWHLFLDRSSASVAGPSIGIGFLVTFTVASALWIAHFVVLASARLRERFHPMLLSHLAALLLLLPSLRIGSQLPFLMRTFFRSSTPTSDQALQPTAGRPNASRYFMKTCPLQSMLALASGG